MSTIAVDVDTQLDFLLPTGALSVSGAARVVERVARLNQWARRRGIVVVSTMDAHTENDAEFTTWPGHCIAGTLGQRKPEATTLTPSVTIGLAPQEVDVRGAAQVIVEKRALDCATNPNLGAVLRALSATHAIVYGVVTEYCVKLAAEALLAHGLTVEIVTDAIETLNAKDGDAALASLTARGVVLRTSDELIG